MHIHHGLSANAEEWVAHCEQVCQQWQVPLVVERVTLADEGLGIEAQARKARYQALRGITTGEALVTAQHLDDQCETFLLALKRGSGPAGLSAMPAVCRTHCCVRCWRNARIAEAWARQHQLAGLKMRVIRMIPTIVISCACAFPAVERALAAFRRGVARSASLCAEQEQLLDELLARAG
jgi:tRNA(Ile)-lysidine synthase